MDLQTHCGMMDSYPGLDAQRAVQHAAGALRYKTVSYEDVSRMDGDAFLGLHQHIKDSFPLVHQTMERTVVNKWSLLYRWPGQKNGRKPILLMSHLDVVPVMPGTEGDWTYPAFSGEVADGYIWGRGAIDTKLMATGALEAAEYLIGQGFMPDRDVYFCFGHDEETMGQDGSYSIMLLLRERGVELEYVLDEGVHFDDGAQYGAPGKLIAKVGVFEKGYADVEVVATDPGGHSSTPGKHTALGRVCHAVAAIEDAPMNAFLCAPLREFYSILQPYITDGPISRLADDVTANADELAAKLAEEPWSAALVRTTTAATMAEASPAPNVLPQKARAVFNFRTMPGDSLEFVIQHCKNSGSGYNVDIALLKGMEASGVSRTDTRAFALLKETIGEFFPTSVAVPFIMAGATDARYFEEICECVYRFRPFITEMELRDTVHATNERLDVDCYIHGVKFLIRLIERSCS